MPEIEFIKRLDTLSRRHGLEMKVFQHSSLKRVAEAFAQAHVVIGPHGGAFANMIFLNPEFDPVIIETHIHQSVYDCCKKHKEWMGYGIFYPTSSISWAQAYRLSS